MIKFEVRMMSYVEKTLPEYGSQVFESNLYFLLPYQILSISSNRQKFRTNVKGRQVETGYTIQDLGTVTLQGNLFNMLIPEAKYVQ